MVKVTMSTAATRQLAGFSEPEQGAILITKNSLSSWNPANEEDLLVPVYGCSKLQLRCEVSIDRLGQRKVIVIEVVEIKTVRI